MMRYLDTNRVILSGASESRLDNSLDPGTIGFAFTRFKISRSHGQGRDQIGHRRA